MWPSPELAAELPYRRGAEAAWGNLADSEHAPIEFIRIATPDGDVFPEAQLLTELESLESKLRGGVRVYVHCRGGHGRTGVVVACLLGMLYPELPCEEVLSRIQVSERGFTSTNSKLAPGEGRKQRHAWHCAALGLVRWNGRLAMHPLGRRTTTCVTTPAATC